MARWLRVGLSGKNDKHGNLLEPLSLSTPSGKIVKHLQEYFPNINHINTNLVSHAPLDSEGNLRYPTESECTRGYTELLARVASLQPTHIIILGEQVRTYITESEYTATIVYIPHPSYIFRRQKVLLPQIVDQLLRFR